MIPTVKVHKGIALVFPPGNHGEILEGVFGPPLDSVKYNTYLVVSNPVDRLKTIYKAEGGNSSFKYWLRTNPPIPQVAYVKNPKGIINLDWFSRDLDKIGLSGRIKIPPIPTVKICVSSKIFITQYYNKDYGIWKI